MSQMLLVVTLAGLAFAAAVRTYLRNRKYKLPPRVPGLPIVGNTFQFPLDPVKQGPWAARLAKEYGEMFTIRVGRCDMIFLNSSRVVRELMDKRSSKYSSRAEMPMLSDIMSGGNRIVLMPYNERWRTIRKVMHSVLNSRNMTQFSTYQEIESRQLLWDYLHDPSAWFTHNQRFANSVIVSVVFGRRIPPGDPNLKPLLHQAEAMVEHLQPGATLVDGFPILAKLPKPLQWWRKKGEALYKASLQVYGYELDKIQEKIDAGKAPECFAREFLQSPDAAKMKESQRIFILGSLLEAGSDTSRMTLSQTIAAMVLFPAWVSIAREHLDKVCGDTGRLPKWEDKPQLRYISAAVKESFRWRPFAPIGVPHLISADDEFEGYHFPAGTQITWNSLYISQNEDEYKNAKVFDPARFLDDDFDNVTKGHWAFGPGRRACPGYNVAERNVWMAISRLIYCFDFTAVPGHEIDPVNANWKDYRVAPFEVAITPRSEAHKALILETCADVAEAN
ncbi:cytochrome P450 [Bipolaris maydis]|nr:cytochrome P450 [Bipolaris maydis]